MTANELRDWRQANKLTQAGLADRLEVSTRMIIYWEQGAYPVPRYIELACKAIENE